MNPFFVLLGMYAAFATVLFASGYLYKTARDRRSKEKDLQGKLDFERHAKDHQPEHQETTLTAR